MVSGLVLGKNSCHLLLRAKGFVSCSPHNNPRTQGLFPHFFPQEKTEVQKGPVTSLRPQS